MTHVAIKGHANRGKEVIEILEMLGGKNKFNLRGNEDEWFVLNETVIQRSDRLFVEKGFTLEEFMEKYPYKVGDRVLVLETQKEVTITGMDWRENEVIYETLYQDDCFECFKANELRLLYKEETMEEIKVNIPKGYEFAGVDDDNQQVVFTKIQPQYPKTYEECCKVLGVNPSFDIRMLEDEESSLYFKFIDLVRCRNAYWNIAGKQMGLDRPWEPDWNDEKEFKYGLYHFRNGIMTDGSCINPSLLAFPTIEMREVFYENFKDLIENCKELL